jgi:hypothetical protein
MDVENFLHGALDGIDRRIHDHPNEDWRESEQDPTQNLKRATHAIDGTAGLIHRISRE